MTFKHTGFNSNVDINVDFCFICSMIVVSFLNPLIKNNSYRHFLSINSNGNENASIYWIFWKKMGVKSCAKGEVLWDVTGLTLRSLKNLGVGNRIDVDGNGLINAQSPSSKSHLIFTFVSLRSYCPSMPVIVMKMEGLLVNMY